MERPSLMLTLPFIDHTLPSLDLLCTCSPYLPKVQLFYPLFILILVIIPSLLDVFLMRITFSCSTCGITLFR